MKILFTLLILTATINAQACVQVRQDGTYTVDSIGKKTDVKVEKKISDFKKMNIKG